MTRLTNIGYAFEYSICKLIGAKFKGNPLVPQSVTNQFVQRLIPARSVLEGLRYVGDTSMHYDFESENKKLSVKTNIYKWSVYPQQIGQASERSFIKYFCVDFENFKDIRNFITHNENKLIQEYFNNTFHCPMLYYNLNKDVLLHIDPKEKFDPSKYKFTFSHVVNQSTFNKQTSILMINDGIFKSIGCIQLCEQKKKIMFKFHLKNVLDEYKDSFNIKIY